MYGKLFATAYSGSMFGAGLHVFAVWGYVIANKDADQFVELNPHLLAAVFGCSVDEVQRAIDYLAAPDTRSRSDEEDGRRITPAGQSMMFHVVNGKKYDEIRNSIERREQNRLAQKKFRSTHERSDRVKKDKPAVSMGQHGSADGQPGSAGSAPISVTIDTARDTERPSGKEKTISAPPKAASRKRSAEKVVVYSDAFHQAWAIYPRRADSSKMAAWRQWSARMAEGVSETTMAAGTQAYADQCARENKEPRYIKLAQTFYGRDRHFEASFEPVAHTPSEDELLRKAPPELRARIARIESIAAEDAAEEERSLGFAKSRGGR